MAPDEGFHVKDAKPTVEDFTAGQLCAGGPTIPKMNLVPEHRTMAFELIVFANALCQPVDPPKKSGVPFVYEDARILTSIHIQLNLITTYRSCGPRLWGNP